MVADLCIIASDTNIESAYQKLMMEKEAFFKEMLEKGDADLIPLPSRTKRKRNWNLSDVTPFCNKGAIGICRSCFHWKFSWVNK